jgi:formamidopyrimidine-DNA glycosylase
MPELPEVEIVRRNLTRWTVGRTVVRVDAPDQGRLDGDPEALVGRRVRAWRRRGKLLLGELDGDLGVLSHLGMTGKWVHAPGDRRFVRLTLTLDDGGVVGLVDARRLGRTTILRGRPEDHPTARALGPDPLLDGLTGATLRARLGGGRAPLKQRLLEQGRVAGLGNICVVEACHRARLHPHTPLDAVPDGAWDALAAAALDHIAATLEAEDGDEVAYVNEGGDNAFLAYGKAGSPCSFCGAIIARAVLAGRPSYYCPACQPLPN